MSFPARGTWIEIVSVAPISSVPLLSFPARGTWIEIPMNATVWGQGYIVPREGNVD